MEDLEKNFKDQLVSQWVHNTGRDIAEIMGSLDTSVASSDGLPLGPPVWEDDERLKDLEEVYRRLAGAKAIVDAMAEKHEAHDFHKKGLKNS